MKRVGVADFKAHLGEHLRAVRHGQSVVVLDRKHPIARLVPYEEEPRMLPVRRATRGFDDVDLPPSLGRGVDSLAVLLEERELER